MVLAIERLVPKGLNRVSLEAVCNFYDIPYENAHDAYADALMTKEVYQKMDTRQMGLF